MQEYSKVVDIISKYERESEQKVVFSKNVCQVRREEIISILGVKEVDKQGKYLGLPTIFGD